MVKNAELAELTGIILGDGSFYINKGLYQLDIAFNSNESHIAYVKRLLRRITAAKIYTKSERTAKCKHLRICSKRSVLEILENTIEKAGNKIENKVTIPHWVWRNGKLLRACIRGLIDTDGSIYYLKPHWPNLLQLSFKNNNSVLLEDTRKAFVKLGFTPSKIFGNRFVLTRQKEISRYLKEIGTKN